MALTIRQKADRIGGFRFVSVFLMETLASWVPTTAELEVKILFGRHVWDFAQHADQLGRRTGELRAPLQYSHPPAPAYARILESVASTTGALDRVAIIYDIFLPDLERRYRAHIVSVDRLDDEPSVRIIERILNDLRRLQDDRALLGRERPDLRLTRASWPGEIAALLAGESEMVAERVMPRPATRTA